MAGFLHRALAGALAEDGPPSPFTDAIGSVYAEDIAGLQRNEVTQGCNPPVNDRFCPNRPISRAEMAVFPHPRNLYPYIALGGLRDDVAEFITAGG